MLLRTRHQAGCAWFRAAAYDSEAVAAGQTIGGGFVVRRSHSCACCRSAGALNSAYLTFQPDGDVLAVHRVGRASRDGHETVVLSMLIGHGGATPLV